MNVNQKGNGEAEKEKGYKVLFENKICLIKDEEDNDILKVKMREKSFALNPLEEK